MLATLNTDFGMVALIERDNLGSLTGRYEDDLARLVHLPQADLIVRNKQLVEPRIPKRTSCHGDAVAVAVGNAAGVARLKRHGHLRSGRLNGRRNRWRGGRHRVSDYWRVGREQPRPADNGERANDQKNGRDHTHNQTSRGDGYQSIRCRPPVHCAR